MASATIAGLMESWQQCGCRIPCPDGYCAQWTEACGYACYGNAIVRGVGQLADAGTRVISVSCVNCNHPLRPVVAVGEQVSLEVSNQAKGLPMTYWVYKDVSGFWRWYLQAANGKKIANSGEGYWNKSDCYAAIHLVASSAGTPIEER